MSSFIKVDVAAAITLVGTRLRAALAVVANAHVELVARVAVANTAPATLAQCRDNGMALLECVGVVTTCALDDSS